LINGRNAKIGKGKGEKKKRDANVMVGLPAAAIWELLNPLTTPVIEQSNPDPTLKLLTGRDGPVNAKYAYSDAFEKNPLPGQMRSLSYLRRNHPRRRIEGTQKAWAEKTMMERIGFQSHVLKATQTRII
jgi:hypothetical protein